MAVTYKSSSVASGAADITIYMPSGYVAGDLLLMQVLTRGQNMSGKPGWSELYRQSSTWDTPAFTVFYKISDGTENFVNFNTVGASDSLAGAYAFSGVDPILPIHATGSMAWGNSMTVSSNINLSSSECYPLFMGMVQWESYLPSAISSITGGRTPVLLSDSLTAGYKHRLYTWFTPVMGTNTVVYKYDVFATGFLGLLALNAMPPVPPIKMNIGGVWKPATDARCNIGGVWKEIKQVEQNIGGIWKQPV